MFCPGVRLASVKANANCNRLNFVVKTTRRCVLKCLEVVLVLVLYVFSYQDELRGGASDEPKAVADGGAGTRSCARERFAAQLHR